MEEHNELFQQFADDPLFLKQITDSGPAITYVLDLEKNDFIYINISANDVLGNDKSYFFMQGRNIFREIVHPDDYERTIHYIDLLSKEDHTAPLLEARLKIKDNYYRWFRFSDYIFKRNEYGRPVRSIGVAQDIHEAKLATQESEKLNNWFNSVLEQSPNGITALRAIRNRNGEVTDLEYIFANRMALEAIQKPELKGTLFCKDLPSLKQTGLFNKYVHVIETGIPWEDEVYYNDEQGVEAWLHVSVSKLDDGCIANFFDVSERKRIEQQIIKQERQYHSLVENTPDVISRWDKNLKLIYANSAAEIKTGVPRETLYGTTSVEMGQPEEIALPWMDKLQEVFETGNPVTYESPFPTPHGSADFLYRIVPEKNSEGEVETVLAIARDITEIKKKERQVRESTEVLNGIMNAPNVGIAVVKAIRNTDGTIEDFQCEFANRRTVESIGKDPTGMTLTAYGKDATVQLEYFKEAIAAGKKITYTIKTEVGGVERWILLSNASFGNDRVVQAWEDITEIKKTEQQVLALQEQLAERAQDKYKTLFNSINEGFCIIEKLEVEGPVDFRFIEANPAFKAHTGADVEEVIGMTIREAFPQESEEWFQIYDEIVKTGKEAKFERAMDSQDRILELYAFRVNDETTRRVAIVFRDITERKRAEFKLRESKELMENIAGTIPDMISVQEYPSRKMIYFNRDAYRTNGLDIDEMKNMTVEQRHALIHPDDEPGLRKFADSLASLSNGQVATHEYRSKTKTKDWIWLRVRSKVFERDEQGNVTSIVNVIQNITDRKEAEQKIRDDHDLLQSIIGSSLSTIRVMNAVRNAEGEIVDFRYVLKNNSVGGYTDTDRIGKLFSEIHPELMESEMFNNFKKVVQTGERVDFQVELDMGLEGDRWIRSVLVKLGDGFVSASEDITDRKRLETNAAFLVDIQNDLGHLQDEEQILTTVGSKIGRFMNAATCMLVEIDQQLDGASPRYLWRREGMPKSSSQFHISDFVKEQARHLLNSGKTIVVRDVDNDPLVNSAPHRSIQALSSIKVPLSRNNQWKYLIIVNDSKPRDWRRDEVEVFQEFAYRLSTRIERARAEAMQRQLEETLRSQLENKVQQRGEELKKTRELLQSVSDAANNLLAGFNIVYSPNGEVEDFELLMCNKVMAFVIGQNSERLSGARYSMIFPASIRNGGFERIKEVARTGIPADFELWYSREETDRWFRCSVSKLSNMIILNGKDITELKKIHTDQQQSLELLRRAETLVKTISNGATGMRDEIKNIRKMIGGAIDASTPEKDKPE